MKTELALNLRRLRTAGIGIVAVAATAACAPVREPPEAVAANAPSISYNYSTDDGLVEANNKARTYCSQYASTPALKGSIVDNSDGSKTVTFECVKSAAVTPAPAAPATTGYTYHSDAEFLQSMQSADAYCAQSGQTAATNIVTNADGSKTVTFHCVAR